MQVGYVDRYEARLQVAVEKAEYLASVNQWRIPGYTYLGAVNGEYEKRHYYYDKSEEKYYYESDFARQMRIKLRNNRFLNYAKK